MAYYSFEDKLDDEEMCTLQDGKNILLSQDKEQTITRWYILAEKYSLGLK
jgi:hypothetical protein